jgi:hypothetical protein
VAAWSFHEDRSGNLGVSYLILDVLTYNQIYYYSKALTEFNSNYSEEIKILFDSYTNQIKKLGGPEIK